LLFLGFKVSGKGITPDPKKVEAVKKWPVPCSVSDVRTFLGFANYHRRFIKDFAALASPLTELTKKTTLFSWTSVQQESFDRLRDALATAPVLDHPKPNAPFILDTDASAYAIGAVLSQIIDGEEHVIAYASQTLSKSQRNYCTTHRELLAVVQFTKHFKHFLWGRHFTVRTDHSSLRWLLNYKDSSGMVARWLSKLQEYDLEIIHRPGAQHLNADGLSRCHSCKNPQCKGFLGLPPPAPKRPRAPHFSTPLPDPSPVNLLHCDVPEILAMPVLTAPQQRQGLALDKALQRLSWLDDYSRDDVSAAQQLDPHIGPVHRWLSADHKPSTADLAPHSEETKALASRWRSLSIVNGILIRSGKTSRVGRPINQTVLPTALRDTVLHQLHDIRVSGHLGIQRTIARVHQKFYWPGLSLDVARWCAACPECASRKGNPGPGRVPLTSLPTGAPFERIAMDILDTRKRTARGYQYILVISDYFTKYTDAFPLRRHTAQVVTYHLLQRWIFYHGPPKQIHSDQGAEFESLILSNVTKLLNIRKTRTSPYRPQSDGQVERFNRTLLGMLSAFVTADALDWDTHLGYVLAAYRSSVNSSTGCTPYSMVYGREYTMPVDLVYPDPVDSPAPPACGPEYVSFIRKGIEAAHKFARDHLRVAAVRQKRGYDAHARNRPAFNPGDLVRYYYPPAKQTNKFARPWLGPFKVIDQPTTVDYTIQLVSDPTKTRTVHIDNLKPYVTPLSPDPDQYAPTADVLDDDNIEIDQPVTQDNPEPLVPAHPERLDLPLAVRRPRRTVHAPLRFRVNSTATTSPPMSYDLVPQFLYQ